MTGPTTKASAHIKVRKVAEEETQTKSIESHEISAR